MTGDDFAVTAGWGHFGTGDAVMPGQGRVVERSYMPEDPVALGETVAALGETTFDVYLNARTFWRNVPASVWRYKLGGYQVLKKWLSYRERSILNRPLKPALLHGPEQIADLPVPVGESPDAVSIGHAERGHLVEYLAPNSVFNSLPRQRSSPHLGPHDRLVTIDRVLHHASLGAA